MNFAYFIAIIKREGDTLRASIIYRHFVQKMIVPEVRKIYICWPATVLVVTVPVTMAARNVAGYERMTIPDPPLPPAEK